MQLSLRYAALSDVGRVRKDNQDSGFASEHLLVVADGVGGAARGDIASSAAVQMMRRLDAPAPQDMLEAMAGAIHRAHDRIGELVEEDPELEGTSTTVTAVLFDGSKIAVGHVGDSRAYLLRDGTLSQLTKDHTFVQGLIDEGRITEEQSRNHPHRNLILRAVDGVHDPDPDLFLIELAPGDRLLLCSDGCSGALDDNRLADILGTGGVDYAVVELVRAALEAGSTDNVTCVVADATDATAAADREDAAATTAPMLVGAAAEQPRRAGTGSKSFFRGHRGGDTGELEPVPADGDDLDPEELRYMPRAPRRFGWVRRIAALVVLGLVLWGLATVGYRWTQQQYYVAAHDSRVAIYQGVQADLPGITLTHLYQPTRVTLQALPAYRAEQVRSGIGATGLDDARDIVSRLTDLARVCPTPTPTPSPTTSDTQRPRTKNADTRQRNQKQPTASPAPSPTKKPRDNGSPQPSPSPSPTIKPPDCIEAAS
jgi:protein phosphatase